MTSMFGTILKLLYRQNISDKVRFRYKIMVNIFLGVNVLLVSIIIDQSILSNLTGLSNPWIFILAGYIVSSLLSAIFHMPRAFAQNDIREGRFEYIVTTKGYRRNYFWYYAVALFLIELINLSPVILVFLVIIFISSSTFYLQLNLLSIVSSLILILFAFSITILISVLNMYGAIISRRYSLNSSLVIIILGTFSGLQFPFQIFSFPFRLLALLNPIAVSIEIWRYIVLPGYLTFVPFFYLLAAVILHLIILLVASNIVLRIMNEKIRIDGVGKLLE